MTDGDGTGTGSAERTAANVDSGDGGQAYPSGGSGRNGRGDGDESGSDSRNDRAGSNRSGGDGGRDGSDEDGRAGRDIVVPMRLYKTVTVFSTLIAVICVVFGFMLLDAATLNVSFLGAIVRGTLAAVGLNVGDGVLRTVFAATGLGIIAFGAGVYVVGTRFRAPGMGKSQEDSGEGTNNNG